MCSMSSLKKPRLLIAHKLYLQYRHGFARLLDVYNKDTEPESVEEPDNEETTQRQPALTTSTGLLYLFLLPFWHYSLLFIVFIVFTGQQKYFSAKNVKLFSRIIGLVLRKNRLGFGEILIRIMVEFEE